MCHDNGASFKIYHQDTCIAEINWSVIGSFNVENALSAFAAAVRIGVAPHQAAQALAEFKPVKRRLEVTYEQQGITVYDDFAHHPTAIGKTVSALYGTGKHERILLALEFGSYSMREGIHLGLMKDNLDKVNVAYVLEPNSFILDDHVSDWPCSIQRYADTPSLAADICQDAKPGDAVLIVSNRGMNKLSQQLIDLWQQS